MFQKNAASMLGVGTKTVPHS
jgi:hypothetical protein